MKIQKLIPLTIDYESSEISENWVAFKILRTLENTVCLEGVTHKSIWNTFLKDPFSVIPYQKILRNDFVFIHPEVLQEYPNFDELILGLENTYSVFKHESSFEYDIFKNYPDYQLFKKDSIAQINPSKGIDYSYLMDLDNKIAYFEHIIELPLVHETKDNKNVFLSLINLLNHEHFEIVPYSNNVHRTKEDYLEGFKNVIDSIKNPYVAHPDDFCAPSPEFHTHLGKLQFKIPKFTEFDEFFQLTKKYVEIDNFGVCNKNFPRILNLAILKTYYDNMVYEDFFHIFPEEYKIAQSIAIDYKLKPKDIHIKKLKI